MPNGMANERLFDLFSYARRGPGQKGSPLACGDRPGWSHGAANARSHGQSTKSWGGKT